ncbi:MAG TPA: hypothetical protein PK299_00040 [Anaerolineales bacterium]|nr:hypothetical protein [Anaerolineales bacterium]
MSGKKRKNTPTHAAEPLSIERYLFPAGLWLLWVGYFRPWIQHPSAALTMSGYMLAEWVRLLPGVQLSQLPFQKIHFRLPFSIAILLTAAWALEVGIHLLWRGKAGALWGRRLALLVALAGCLALLPGYPHLIDWQADPTAPQNIILALCTLIGVLAMPYITSLPQRFVSWLLLALTLFTLGWNGWLMMQVLPPTAQLYGKMPAIGWGWMLMQAGLLLLMVAFFSRRVWGRQIRPTI